MHPGVKTLRRKFGGTSCRFKKKREIKNLELHIVGEGALLQDFKNFKIEGLYVHGPLTEEKKNELLRESWIFVMPSIREGFGRAALEAMAASCPVVTVNAPDNATKELVVNAKGGLVVDANEEAIAQAIIALCQNKALWKQLSNNAKHYAANFDWSHTVDLTEQLLLSAVVGDQ